MTRIKGVTVDLLDGQIVTIVPHTPTMGDATVITLEIYGEDGGTYLRLTEDQWEVLKAVIGEY